MSHNAKSSCGSDSIERWPKTLVGSTLRGERVEGKEAARNRDETGSKYQAPGRATGGVAETDREIAPKRFQM